MVFPSTAIVVAFSTLIGTTTFAQNDDRVVIVNEGWQIFGNLVRPVATQGVRAPAVLLLNAAGRDRRDYEAFARDLAARGIGSLRIDLRGMGESTNLGRFVPFDSTGQNALIKFERGWSDVQAALRFLERQRWVDPDRIGAVGASFSGEALAVAIAGSQRPRAVAMLSPGSFSDSSLARVDRDGRRWLFVYSAREMIVRRWAMDTWTRRGTKTARVITVLDSAHATRLLTVSPLLSPRLAEWFWRALGGEANGDRWRIAADRVSATVATEWDDLLNRGHATPTLADGTAGRLHFLLAWHAARGDTASGRAARRTADQLIGQISSDTGAANASLYRGSAGVAWALGEAADRLGVPRFRRVADSIVAALHSSGRRDGQSISWSQANDVFGGDAGIAAALYGIWRRSGDTLTRDLAFAAGRSLLSRARPDSGGSNWLWRESSPLTLPNFSHGAAGVGTVLAIVGGDLNAPATFTSTATGAGVFLRAIATNDARGFRVPYGWPTPAGGWDRPYDAGWAHGQAGTARLFWALWLATRDSTSLATVSAAVRGLDSARVFDAPHPDYGIARFGADYRFGLAGIGELFADLYDETGEREYFDRAEAIAVHLLRMSDATSGAMAWPAPLPVFFPDAGRPARLTGLLHGAAGPGLLFLKLEALSNGRRLPSRLPDSPFGDR